MDRLHSPRKLPTGHLVLTATGSGFVAQDLFGTGRSHRAMQQMLALTGAPISGLEFGITSALRTHIHLGFSPQGTQVIGDPRIFAKYSAALPLPQRLGRLRTGLWLDMRFPTAQGDRGIVLAALQSNVLAMLGWQPIPQLEVVLNAGFRYDNIQTLFSAAAQPHAAQRLSLGWDPKYQLLAALGVQTAWPLRPRLRLGGFGEVSARAALNTNVASPIELSTGMRIFFDPIGLSLSLGMRLRLHGRPKLAAQSFAGLPPWQMQAGIRILLPPHLPKASPSRPQAAPAPKVATFQVEGFVVDATSGLGIDNAQVGIDGLDGPILATQSTDGAFIGWPMQQGDGLIQLYVRAPEHLEQIITLQRRPLKQPLKIELKRATAPAYAILKGILRDATDGSPLAGTLSIPGLETTTSVPKSGRFELKLPPGTHQILVSAPTHTTQRKEVLMLVGDTVILNLDLQLRSAGQPLNPLAPQ